MSLYKAIDIWDYALLALRHGGGESICCPPLQKGKGAKDGSPRKTSTQD